MFRSCGEKLQLLVMIIVQGMHRKSSVSGHVQGLWSEAPQFRIMFSSGYTPWLYDSVSAVEKQEVVEY